METQQIALGTQNLLYFRAKVDTQQGATIFDFHFITLILKRYGKYDVYCRNRLTDKDNYASQKDF